MNFKNYYFLKSRQVLLKLQTNYVKEIYSLDKACFVLHSLKNMSKHLWVPKIFSALFCLWSNIAQMRHASPLPCSLALKRKFVFFALKQSCNGCISMGFCLATKALLRFGGFNVRKKSFKLRDLKMRPFISFWKNGLSSELKKQERCRQTLRYQFDISRHDPLQCYKNPFV